MRTIRQIVMSAGIVGFVVVSAGSAVAAGTVRPSDRPDSGELDSGEFVLPPDYVQLADDTGTLSVAVPNTWTDVGTAPLVNADGSPLPWLTAATNYRVFTDTFDAPGLDFTALPYDPDQQGVMTSLGLTSGCATSAVQPYSNDRGFIGLHGVWSQCGPTQLAEWHQLVVSPADNSRTLVLQIQITGPSEQTVLQNVLDSFDTGAPASTPPTAPMPTPATATAAPATAPVSTVPALPVPSTSPVPTAAPVPTAPVPTAPVATAPVAVPTAPVVTVAGAPGLVPAGFVQLTDDTHSISMVVPATWTDVNTAPFVGESGGSAPRIEAAINLESFQDTFDSPGALLAALPYMADTQTFIADGGLDDGLCAATVTEPFNDGRLAGHVGRWTGCGATAMAEWHIIVASPADHSVTYLLILQITGPAEQGVLPTVIASIGPAPQGGAPAPTTGVPVPPAPTVPLAPTVPVTQPTTPLPTTPTVPTPTVPTPTVAPAG